MLRGFCIIEGNFVLPPSLVICSIRNGKIINGKVKMILILLISPLHYIRSGTTLDKNL